MTPIYNNNFAGYHVAKVIQTTLSNNFSGATNKINLVNPLPSSLASLISQSDVFAFLGCKDQRGEIVRIVKQSYSETNKALTIIRGQSKYANEGFDNNSVIDLGSIPRDITLDFGIIYPAGLQRLSDTVNGLLGYNSDILRGLLPPANQSQIGGVKVAFISSDQQSTFVPSVMPTNATAHEQLYKSIYGSNSISYQTGQTTIAENARVQAFGKLVDWIADNPSRLDTLFSLINTLNADPSKLNEIIN